MQVLTIRELIQSLENMVNISEKLAAKKDGKLKEEYRVGT